MTTSTHRIIPSRIPGVSSARAGFKATFGHYAAPEWTTQSLCSQTDPADFFPASGVNSSRRALATCRTCPVRAKCLEDALAYESGEIVTGQTTSEPFGIRGGLTATQRKPLIDARIVKRQEARRAVAAREYAAGESLSTVADRHRFDRAFLRRHLEAAGVWRDPKNGAS